MKILFQCSNKDEKINHGVNNMLLRNYTKSMLKNTYLYDKCSICNICQNEKTDIIFNYCCICKKVLCDKCSFNHTVKNQEKHPLIKNNQKIHFCDIHPKKDNVVYCLDCKKHLCNKCLESREHILHGKIN